jgi:integrase
MSVRKRTWKTSKGEEKQAWIVDYVDQKGGRHIKTFARKREADAYAARTAVEVSDGTHTPDSASVTIAEAAEMWIETCRARHLERSTIEGYQQHLELHIRPYLGRVKLSQVSAPLVREFEDKLRRGDPVPGEGDATKRSPTMIKKIVGESRGSFRGCAGTRTSRAQCCS